MKRSLFLAFVLLSLQTVAQIDVPAPSPLGKAEQKVGLTDMSITYSRPGVKGRKIFGGLVPFGEMWRWGANASTKLKTSDDITIEGHDVPAGEYALYAIPNQDKWTVIIHKNTTHWGTGGDKYDASEDLVRFDVVPETNYPVKVETMTFTFADITDENCTIEFTWENTRVKLSVKTNTDNLVMKDIEMKMKGVSSATYYQSASYYYHHNKDINKAYEWINLAVKENEKFWMIRLKALIEAKMGDYEKAIETATRSKELAENAGNKDYVRLNEKSIAEWKAELK